MKKKKVIKILRSLMLNYKFQPDNQPFVHSIDGYNEAVDEVNEAILKARSDLLGESE